MAAVKPLLSLPSMPILFSRAAVVLVLVLATLAAHSQLALSQDCAGGIGNLVSCAPYVVPGGGEGPISKQCCTALSDVNTTCLCRTMNIINQLPAACKLPAVSCSS